MRMLRRVKRAKLPSSLPGQVTCDDVGAGGIKVVGSCSLTWIIEGLLLLPWGDVLYC